MQSCQILHSERLGFDMNPAFLYENVIFHSATLILIFYLEVYTYKIPAFAQCLEN